MRIETQNDPFNVIPADCSRKFFVIPAGFRLKDCRNDGICKFLKIALNQPPIDLDLKLYNILGQIAHSERVSGWSHSQQLITFNTSYMASGLYFLRITGNRFMSTHKVIIINN